LRTEEECFSRKILVRCSFERGGKYDPDNAKEHEGKHESGKKRDKEYGLDVIVRSQERRRERWRGPRTVTAAFSPDSNGAKLGMASDAWAPDVLIARPEAGFVNWWLVNSGTVPDRLEREKKNQGGSGAFWSTRERKEPVRIKRKLVVGRERKNRARTLGDE
jgi:hypothetical protein